MRLAFRLALMFGILAAASSAGVGVLIRYRLAATATDRFQKEVNGVCEQIQREVKRQAEADRTLMVAFCENGELVERVGIASDNHDLDNRRLSFSSLVESDRHAFGVEELLVGVGKGETVFASPQSLIGMPAADVAALLRGDSTGFTLRTAGTPAIVTRCKKPSPGGTVVGMVAARHLDPLVDRIALTLNVGVIANWRKVPPGLPPVGERASCRIDDKHGGALGFDVVKSTADLEANLAEVDRAIFVLSVVAAVIAFFVAVLLARSISRPLSVLAEQAGKVAAGEAQPIRVRGSGEVRALGLAFDRMIKDLEVTRRRLAAASRVAAWREVARRVAHEVKNPLAPIRAAVETLRRLRAREDPRFDEYFDEATRTVLDEVHRISNIVTEFTRFARLPPPRPTEIDVEEVAKHVIAVHKGSAGEKHLAHVATRRAAQPLRADRDQVIQVLTNLVQNALDAVKDTPNGAVTLSTDTDGHYVTFAVSDNGPGVSPEFAGRLFEPYATTKVTGTGLGLAIAQRIAYEHNGELSYAGPSANGTGAVFRLVLPLEGPPPMSETPPSSDSSRDV